MTIEAIGEEKLAIDGGTPAKARPNPPMYPGGMQIDEEEKQAVLDALDHKHLFRYYGPDKNHPSKVAALEKAFAEHMGTKYALAVNSGTSSLVAALIAAGIGPGDEVIVPAYTFVASASAVVNSGAVPVIAEVDDSLTLDPAAFEAAITPYTKAVMPVHMRGAPCNMAAIMEIARRHNLVVVEDVAQADGGSFQGQRLGTFGDLGCFSLQFHKIITTGEGGMVVTNEQSLYDRARMYHDAAGIWRSPEERARLTPFCGMNMRMNELCGAVGLVQLTRLEPTLARMREIKRRIKGAIQPLFESKGVQFRRMNDAEGDASVAMIYFMKDQPTAKRFAAALRAENIGAGSMFDAGIPDWHIYAHWTPILNKVQVTPTSGPWNSPWYKGNVEYSADMCPRTLELLGRAVHMDMNPLFTDEDVEQVIAGMQKVAKALL